VRKRWTIGILSAIILLVVLAGVIGYNTLSGGFWNALGRKANCVVSADKLTDLTAVSLLPSRMENAATIAAVGQRRGVPTRGIVVALATALQESKLDNRDEGDRDSVGLFQQRPSQGWGTREQIAQPRYAANAFFVALVKVPGWQNLRVTEAAQAVQKSAYPEAYQKWADEAAVLAAALVGDTTGSVACTLPSPESTASAAAATVVAQDLQLDWGKVQATAAKDQSRVELTTSSTRSGWQLAHWLVAHAQSNRITQVRFANLAWTAEKGTWKQAKTSDQVGDQKVLACITSCSG
jgi:hypothetical protein